MDKEGSSELDRISRIGKTKFLIFIRMRIGAGSLFSGEGPRAAEPIDWTWRIERVGSAEDQYHGAESSKVRAIEAALDVLTKTFGSNWWAEIWFNGLKESDFESGS